MAADGWRGQRISGDVSGATALDRAFTVDTLQELRKAVRARAITSGVPDAGAWFVMLAVHELASNAVVHGGGAGRVRMHVVDGELHCQVSDAGPRGVAGGAAGIDARCAQSWPIEPGRGLWLVRNIAGRLSMKSGTDGSEVTVVFPLPGFLGDLADQ